MPGDHLGAGRARGVWLLVLLARAVSGCQGHCEHPPEVVPIVGALSPPPGYVAVVALDGLHRPTQIQVDTRGRVFILEGGGDDKAVRVFDMAFQELGRVPVPTGGESTGLLVLGDGLEMYVTSRGGVDRFLDAGTGLPEHHEPVLRGLPSGWHTPNNLRLDADGRILLSIGSTCDACDEADPRAGTLVRFEPSAPADTLEVVTRGLRNAYDLAFTAEGELLATDNGTDCCPPGPECPAPTPDLLVHAEEGSHHGWPHTARRKPLPDGYRPPLLVLPMHAGATGIHAYTGQALPDAGRVFVALWGNQHGDTENGRRVLRVRLERDAQGVLTGATAEPFLGPEGLAHPIAFATAADGALLILDYQGFLVRVTALAATPPPGEAGWIDARSPSP